MRQAFKDIYRFTILSIILSSITLTLHAQHNKDNKASFELNNPNNIVKKHPVTINTKKGLATRQTSGKRLRIYIYPNPAKENFHLTIAGLNGLSTTIIIYNTLKKPIETKRIKKQQISNMLFQIDKQGIYFIHIFNARYCYWRKLRIL